MLFLYDLGIFLYAIFVRIAAFKNEKARAWIRGRAGLLEHIGEKVDREKKHVWFHFASLGEFEQGRPVIEELKLHRPSSRIIVTFFSPSGYQIREQYELADHVFYLPPDTRLNAREFVSLINPEFVVFTKYEFWFHYFKTLSDQAIPLYMIAVIFRRSQPFFKFYGSLHRKMLGFVDHFFVQDESSLKLLLSAGFSNATVCGDTRFDRVIKNIQSVNNIPVISGFCAGEKVFIAGSTWPKDEKLLTTLVTSQPESKFIIAPHEVNEKRLLQIRSSFPSSLTLTELEHPENGIPPGQVLIIDRIGILASIYQYGKMAYIGGGFDSGIHNTQEALAFGLPVIFGPKFEKFREAREMVVLGGAISINSADELISAVEHFSRQAESSELARDYIMKNKGATERIVRHLLAAHPPSDRSPELS